MTPNNPFSDIAVLPAAWRKTAKWYRGKGFKWNDTASKRWRDGMARAHEDCAKDLAIAMKRLKQHLQNP